MYQRLVFVPAVPTGTPRKWTEFPFDRAPFRVWSLPAFQDPDARPTLPYEPQHHRTAFLLDLTHDYDVRGRRWLPPRTGDSQGEETRKRIRGEWILLEFTEAPDDKEWAPGCPQDPSTRRETPSAPPVQGLQWRAPSEVTVGMVIAHMEAHGFVLPTIDRAIPAEARHQYSGRVCLFVAATSDDGAPADLTDLPQVLPVMLEVADDAEGEEMTQRWEAFHVEPQTGESYSLMELNLTLAPVTRALVPVAWSSGRG